MTFYRIYQTLKLRIGGEKMVNKSSLFPSLSPKFDWSELEKEMKEFWDTNDVFLKLQEKLKKSKKKWSFVDGPITANNEMGVHHARGRALKDIYQRYHAMMGFNQRFQNGFDCQGLWVEVEVEKSLKFNTKRDIQNYGLNQFNQQCKNRVTKYTDLLTKQSIKLGQFMDWKNSYYTNSDNNIEHIWNFLAKCQVKGWLYQKETVLPWCQRCATSLSTHEMADSYKELTHDSIYLKLPLLCKKRKYILVWTTTPWTLTANTAVAVNPSLNYLLVRFSGEEYLLAEGLEHLLPGQYEVLRSYKGSDLVGLKYESPFGELEEQKDVDHRIVAWQDVSDEEGTGLVHIAPGCGAEDYELGLKNDLSVIVPIDEEGKFLNNFGEFAGLNASESTELVVKQLQDRNFLFYVKEFTHRYPVCWRCKTELLFRLESEWFISTKEAKPQLLEAAKSVNWFPSYVGKRMNDWLHNMGDWCISRKRFWGLPLPFYQCISCNELTVVKTKDHLKELAVDSTKVDSLKELHRPWIDEILINCPNCGEKIQRVKEIGDCWLDAGIVPFSTLNYLKNPEYWKKWFPAELVCEMVEQVRLWFYSLLFMSVTLVGKAPYKNVVTFRRVLNEDGSEMHKSSGTFVKLQKAVDDLSADILRWYYVSQKLDSPLYFGYKQAYEFKRKFSPLWNSLRFFTNFASLDVTKLSQLNHKPKNLLDRWITERMKETVEKYHQYMNNFDVHSISVLLNSFIDDLTNTYIRFSRKRFWKQEESEDKYSAYSTLYQVLLRLTQLLAPITPYLSEKMFQILKNGSKGLPVSVHLHNLPKKESVDYNFLKEFDDVVSLIRLGLSARNQSKIKLRQPLSEIVLSGSLISDLQNQSEYETLLKESLNVKSVNYSTELTENPQKLNTFVLVDEMKPKVILVLNTTVTDELLYEGLVREIVRRVQSLRKEMNLNINDKIKLKFYSQDSIVKESLSVHNKYLLSETLTTSLEYSKDPLPTNFNVNKQYEFSLALEKVEV